MSKETEDQAQARRAADCAQHGHGWIAPFPNGARTQCSWCGARRSQEESERDETESQIRIAGPGLKEQIDWILRKLE